MTSWILELLSSGLDWTFWELWELREQARPRIAANSRAGWSSNWSHGDFLVALFCSILSVMDPDYCCQGKCITLHTVMLFDYFTTTWPSNSWTRLLYVNIYYNSRGLYNHITITIFIQIAGYITHSEWHQQEMMEVKTKIETVIIIIYFAKDKKKFSWSSLFCFALKWTKMLTSTWVLYK